MAVTEAPIATGRIILTRQDYTVSLKQLIPDDAKAFFNLIAVAPHHLNQNGNQTTLDYPTVEAVAESIVRPKNPSTIRFGIWEKETLNNPTEAMVGSMDLTSTGSGRAKLDFWVGFTHTGNHLASRAVRPIVDYAFGELGLDEISCEVATPNTPAVKSLERAGFKKTNEIQSGVATVSVYTLKSPQKS